MAAILGSGIHSALLASQPVIMNVRQVAPVIGNATYGSCYHYHHEGEHRGVGSQGLVQGSGMVLYSDL